MALDQTGEIPASAVLPGGRAPAERGEGGGGALSVTQPAVSKTIRELEDLLGVALFERRGRGVALTRFGEVFLRYAGASVTALRQGIDSITQARTKGGMAIKVGALPTVSTRVMPLAVSLFKQENMGTVVRVVTGDNSVLISQLRTGDLDLVVGRLADPDLMTGLSFEHLYSERVSFVVRPDHPLLRDKPFDLAKIASFTVLMPAEGSIIRPLVDRFLITHGIATIPDQIETVSMAFGRRYTRMTDAVWIISRGVIADDLVDGVLAELPVATDATTRPRRPHDPRRYAAELARRDADADHPEAAAAEDRRYVNR